MRIAFFMEDLILFTHWVVIIYRCASDGKGGGYVSDDELIDRIKSGDEAAAEELIDRYYDAILRYCGWHCAAPEKAEDLTQETFFKLFRSLPGYRDRNKFKAYLYTIANRLCIDESRKRPIYSLEDAGELATGQNEIVQAENREEIRRFVGGAEGSGCSSVRTGTWIFGDCKSDGMQYADGTEPSQKWIAADEEGVWG